MRRRFQLTPSQEAELRHVSTTSKSGTLRTRAQAVRLYGTNYPIEEVMEICGCCRNSIMNWCQAYRQGGLAGLRDHRTGGNNAKLTKVQRLELKDRLHRYSPRQLFGDQSDRPDGRYWSLPDFRRAIERWYGVVYGSSASYYSLFAQCGFTYQRSEKRFKSRKEAEIMTFEEQLEKKLIDVAQDAPDTVFMASDEASLYLQATTTSVWAPRGQTPYIRAAPCRQKVCFYGTLNLHSGKEIATRSAKMNAQESAGHLRVVLAEYPGRPIVLFWDRAPWHRGKPIDQVLQENPRLEIWRLPVAAPDLNPQEHVWKATRRAVSHNHDVPHLVELADQFENHLKHHTFHCSLLDRYGFNAICPMFK